MSMSISIWLVSLAVGLPQADLSSDKVVAPGAKLEKLWGEGSFTEGGAMAEDGSILFSDIGNRIMRFDPKTNKTTVYREPSGRANGMIFDNLGRLIVAEGANTGGGRRVSITERDGTIKTLADNYDNRRFNSPNDVAVDSQGRVYVSDPRYVGDEPRELDFEGVFLLSLEGFPIPMITNAYKPNGLVLSPDGKILYVSDNGSRRRVLIATDVGAAGKVANPRVIHDFGASGGIDGMTVTTDGRIVAAGGDRNQAGVLVLSPAGQIEALIPVPEQPANVEFGGDDGKTLYIMAGKSLYRIKTTMTGFRLWPRP
jgi:gluconolactonase